MPRDPSAEGRSQAREGHFSSLGSSAADAFFAAGATSDLVDRQWSSPAFEHVLRELRRPVELDDVSRPELLLHRDDRVEIFFAPLDQINLSAKVVIVGLTPGRAQARIALDTVVRELDDGADLPTAVRTAKTAASFAGTTRHNLVRMLDDIGLPAALELESCRSLFEERRDLVATTSAVCHPVFVCGGRNYSGSPRLDRHPVLRAFAQEVLRGALSLVPRALVVPLGVEAARGVRLAGIDPARELAGFPHPSGGNGHRVATFTRERAQLTTALAAWQGHHRL